MGLFQERQIANAEKRMQRRLEKVALEKGLCPFSGLVLTNNGEGKMFCKMCDCFGFEGK